MKAEAAALVITITRLSRTLVSFMLYDLSSNRNISLNRENEFLPIIHDIQHSKQ